MERVAFLVEDTGERLEALLNPDSVVMRRFAGVRPRSSLSGSLSGAGLSDDPLLYTGGGRTVLELELLFDMSVADTSFTTNNVRELTGPLWELAENKMSLGQEGYAQPRLVRFVWGKTWNVLGAVTDLAERLEQFNSEGAPQRSWMKMRLVRVSEPISAPADGGQPPADMRLLPEDLSGIDSDTALENDVQIHEVICGGEATNAAGAGAGIESDINNEEDNPGTGDGGGESGQVGGAGERLDEIAVRYYGENNAHLWRLIAALNNIEDPTHVPCGTLLRIPSLSSLARSV
jgi:hypothetical protein